MPFNINVNDVVRVNQSYVNNTLAEQIPGNAVLESLGYLDNETATVTNLGSLSSSFFVQLLPLNTQNPLYNNGQGAVLYFPNLTLLNNSFELSPSFLDSPISSRALNTSGGLISKGQVVYLTGYNSTQQLPTIALASASALATSVIFGICGEDIANNNIGDVIIQGSFQGIDTSGFSVGNLVFLNNTPGAIANMAGTNSSIIGTVIVANVKGTITLGGLVTINTGGSGGTGQTGLQGIQGNTGIQGISGVTGLALGSTGIAGTNGTTGLTGSTGITGLTGNTGSGGTQGNTGLIGTTGLTGSTGITGLTGNTGSGGIQGNTGFEGTTGFMGATGLGLPGNTGLKGTTGLQGATGVGGSTPTLAQVLVAGNTTGGTNVNVSDGDNILSASNTTGSTVGDSTHHFNGIFSKSFKCNLTSNLSNLTALDLTVNGQDQVTSGTTLNFAQMVPTFTDGGVNVSGVVLRGLLVNPTINLGAGSSGHYEGLTIKVKEQGVAGLSGNYALRVQGFSSGNVDLFALNNTGKAIIYNETATAGFGLSAIVGQGRVIGATAANASIATYNTGTLSDGSFEVSMNCNVTAATSISTSLNCSYTDENNVAQTIILPITSTSGNFLSGGLITTTGVFQTPAIHIRCKVATNITLFTATGTFSSVAYSAEGIIKQTSQ